MSPARPSRPVRRVLAAAASVTGAMLVALPTSTAQAAASETVTLDHVRVRLSPGTKQVVTVKRTSGFKARITIWGKTDRGWVRRVQSSTARLGFGGLVEGDQRRQGTGTTPLGTYPLPMSFGRLYHHRAWDLPYKKLDGDDYWVQDNASRYYNRYRDKDAGGFRWWLRSGENTSERLADYPSQYEMAIVIGFNYTRPVKHRGAGIFLHVNARGATAGCVSASRPFILSAMNGLKSRYKPVIAIGR